MNRKEFVKLCAILGVGFPLQSSLSSCKKVADLGGGFSGKVIIIGAGAGGLSAGYLLHQQGIDFEILEASSVYGGRMRINTDFANFPIPLGAEWLETDPSIFPEIVNDSSKSIHVTTTPDDPDRKFVNYSWFNFFEEYIVPSISDRISYNSVVASINYSGDKITVTTQNGQKVADKVIVSVPLKILQDGDVTFEPSLPQNKRNARILSRESDVPSLLTPHKTPKIAKKPTAKPTPYIPLANLMPASAALTQFSREFDRERRMKQLLSKEADIGINTREAKYAPYAQGLVRALEEQWQPAGERMNELSQNERRVLMRVSIENNGELGGIKIVQPSPSRALNDSAIAAVHAAAPFKPLPSSWGLERAIFFFVFEVVEDRAVFRRL
ncbi:MAG: TonB family protein [Ghiorsea sp.]|nr:TonB family protein [Ghiorsea sp.]